MKKCDDMACKFHEWNCISDSELKNLHHLLTPIPDSGKYKDFNKVYGLKPSDMFCPNL